MANVPNTTTFSLNDVYVAVSSHASPAANLSDCFAKSVDSYFDATYKGSKNALYNFRNYTVAATTTTTTAGPTTTTTTTAATTTTTTTSTYSINWSTNMTMGGIFQVYVGGTAVLNQGSAGSGSLGPYASGTQVYVLQNSGGCQYGAASSLTGASSGSCNTFGCDATTSTINLYSNVTATGTQYC